MSYHRQAIIRNLNFEFGELMSRINRVITSIVEENKKFNIEKITNWDINCKEDKKCLSKIEVTLQDLGEVKSRLSDKMHYKELWSEAIHAPDTTDERILELGEKFSQAYLEGNK